MEQKIFVDVKELVADPNLLNDHNVMIPVHQVAFIVTQLAQNYNLEEMHVDSC